MYRCGICREVTKPKVKAVMVTEITRAKKYPFRRNAFKLRGEQVDDQGGDGVEIVKETKVCPECLPTTLANDQRVRDNNA